jgi:hypothetical protein
MFYSEKACFNLSGYMGSQNNKYWSTENPHAAHEVPMHDLKDGVWCAFSAWRITGAMFFH